MLQRRRRFNFPGNRSDRWKMWHGHFRDCFPDQFCHFESLRISNLNVSEKTKRRTFANLKHFSSQAAAVTPTFHLTFILTKLQKSWNYPKSKKQTLVKLSVEDERGVGENSICLYSHLDHNIDLSRETLRCSAKLSSSCFPTLFLSHPHALSCTRTHTHAHAVSLCSVPLSTLLFLRPKCLNLVQRRLIWRT